MLVLMIYIVIVLMELFGFKLRLKIIKILKIKKDFNGTDKIKPN